MDETAQITILNERTVFLKDKWGYHYTNRYADLFWRPYLGADIYALYSLMKSWTYELTGSNLPLFASIMGRSPYDKFVSELALLTSEYVIAPWVDRHGSQRYALADDLPLLTVSQVAKLPNLLQRYHDESFEEQMEWGGSSITYDQWTQASSGRATFLKPIDVVWLEACEIRREEAERADRYKEVRRELTPEKKQAILERDGRTCRYCGQPATAVDHITPVVLGGDNDPENLAAACRTCNSRKHARTPEQAGMTLRPSPQCVAPSVQIAPTI